MGAREAASPKEMAEKCDIIHICLSNSPQIEATMHRPDGVLAGARPGLIVIETSTANPAWTKALAAEPAAKGGGTSWTRPWGAPRCRPNPGN